jgi:cation transport ATPase
LAGASALGEWTEAATLGFLFALAGRMESWSLERARESITRVVHDAPQAARIVHGSHTHVIDANRVTEGVLVRVETGERIPCDGLIERGSAWINQALITGESVAVEKQEGARVWAGTMVEEGGVEVRATGAGRDTALARMLRMVESSATRRAASEQAVERFARHYTPFVLLAAAFVAVAPPLLGRGSWADWAYQGMLVLLVACPCALVISTPVTVTAAIAAAARNGAIVKGGALLEQAARLKALTLSACLESPPVGWAEEMKLKEAVQLPPGLDEQQRADFAASQRARYGNTAMMAADPGDELALRASSLGLAFAGPGSDFTAETAGVVLFRGGLESIAFLLRHSRRALRVIHQNIVAAVSLKILFLAAVLAGSATLWMAVAADMGATVLVTLNGLRLLRAEQA